MKVSRLMSAREFKAYMEGKTIRPLHDWSDCDNNTIDGMVVCFAPADESCHILDILDMGMGYIFATFEINAKHLSLGTGWYGGEPHTEYYAGCYNKRIAKLVGYQKIARWD